MNKATAVRRTIYFSFGQTKKIEIDFSQQAAVRRLNRDADGGGEQTKQIQSGFNKETVKSVTELQPFSGRNQPHQRHAFLIH